MRKRKPVKPTVGVLMIDVKQVAARCGLGVSTVWKLASKNSQGFPSPVVINARCKRWRTADIENWVKGLA